MTRKPHFQPQHSHCLGVIGGIILATSPTTTLAQIAGDGTLGTQVNGSAIAPCTGVCAINGGTERGVNLYHSFKEFSIPTGGQAWFNNAPQIQNILTRVTGNTISNIDGLIKANGTANLFLLNPNGIVFGPYARLQIGGSFLATTASSFKFSDGSEFSAIHPQAPPLLTVNVIPGLQFGPTAASITNRGNLSAGQDLTLAASNLDVQGTVQAGRDLTLQAQDTVKVRDTIAAPLIAVAGGSLQVQGDRSVDIFTLNHPNSGFWSGGELVLRSGNPVVGDAHFYAGGDFQVEQLNGQVGTLLSPHDPIILSNGDVTLGDYTGASLHILARGSVTLGNVTITGTGDVATTINPNNTNLFNGSRRYADLATFNLTTYQATLNSDGSVRSVDPVAVPITINGSTQATLDVRAGVDWATLGGLPTTPVLAGVVTPAPTATATASSANITLNGTIRVAQPAGLVLLTNQFSPNTLPGTISIQGDVDTHTMVPGANGGDIRVYGRGDIAINTPLIQSFPPPSLDSSSSSTVGNAANGGAISFATNFGNIALTYSSLSSFSSSPNVGAGNAGNGGAISFTTNSGNITLTSQGPIVRQGIVNSSSYNAGTAGNGGNGGRISFTTNSGNISLINALVSADASPYSSSGTAGNGGNGGRISFTTNSGNISLTTTGVYADAEVSADFVNAGNGGAISFATNSGNISLTDTGVSVRSVSDTITSFNPGNAGNGGAISFATNSGNITLTGTGVYADASGSGYLYLRDAGNGGAISFATNSGSITLLTSFLDSPSFSAFGTAENGGAISFATNSGNIALLTSSLTSSSSSFLGIAGNGGSIKLSAKGGTISGSASALNSFAVSGQGDSGSGGTVTLEAGRKVSGLTISTVASGGLSGDVAVNGFGNLQVFDTRILTAQQVTVNTRDGLVTIPLSDRGQAGNVTVASTGSLTLSNSTIESDTRGGNPAGNISFNVNQGIAITDGSTISARTTNSGQAGNISFNAPTLLVSGDAQVLAETAGSGTGGSIFVNAPTSVALRRTNGVSPVLSVETSGAGKAGDILVNTPTLTLADQARITATATATATNLQGGGSITLNASTMHLAGVVGVFAETQGQAPAGTLRLNPYNNQPDLTITLSPSAKISASTSGSGNGGDLILTAPRSITITGPGQLAVETSSTGNAGNINVTTQQLNLTDGVQLSASTSGRGKAGDIEITASTVNLNQGAQVFTNTSASGQAGNVSLHVQDAVTLSGNGTGLFASTTVGSTGNGGNIIIDPRTVFIQDGAAISVDSQGRGTGGNISIQAGRLELRDKGSITAETASAQGGNINLDVKDLVLLRRDSLISTTAGTAQAGGDGGNINMRAPFVVGVLRENSDISANAYTGRGGNITITTNAIYGLQFQPQLTPFSDITASSQFGLSGTVAINTLNLDPSRGLAALPVNLTDPSQQISQSCTPGSKTAANSFVATGRGGIPLNPDEPLESRAVVTKWVPLPEEGKREGERQTSNVSPVRAFSVENKLQSDTIPPAASISLFSPPPTSNVPTSIVEAQGWLMQADGTTELVVDRSTANPVRAWTSPVNCQTAQGR